MKDVLVKVEDRIKENASKIRNTPSGDNAKIFVAGGQGTNSVGIFNWSKKSWSPMCSRSKKRNGATGFVHNHHMITAGGFCDDTDYVDNMVRMKIDPNPDLSTHWSDCPVKLPAKLACHQSVVYNDYLYVTGGCIENLDQVSDRFDEILLVPSYTVNTL